MHLASHRRLREGKLLERGFFMMLRNPSSGVSVPQEAPKAPRQSRCQKSASAHADVFKLVSYFSGTIGNALPSVLGTRCDWELGFTGPSAVCRPCWVSLVAPLSLCACLFSWSSVSFGNYLEK